MEAPDIGNEKLNLLLDAFIGDNATDWAREKVMNYERLMSYYRCAMMEVETKFNVLNEEFSLQYNRNPINSIQTRLKSLHSIREKLQKRGLPLTMSSIEANLNDVAGVRVICSFPQDVTLLTESFLRQDDVTLLRKKDYISNPKENGYRSMHLIISIPIFLASEKRSMNVEIQLRTIAMDCWASLEHQLRYKMDNPFTAEMSMELNECARLSSELDRRMDALRHTTLDQELFML